MCVQSDILKELRKDKGYTQEYMGHLFDISAAMYSMYENGKRRMSLEMLCQLADLLGTSTDYLLGRTDDSTPYSPKRNWRNKEE